MPVNQFESCLGVFPQFSLWFKAFLFRAHFFISELAQSFKAVCFLREVGATVVRLLNVRLQSYLPFYLNFISEVDLGGSLGRRDHAFCSQLRHLLGLWAGHKNIGDGQIEVPETQDEVRGQLPEVEIKLLLSFVLDASIYFSQEAKGEPILALNSLLQPQLLHDAQFYELEVHDLGGKLVLLKFSEQNLEVIDSTEDVLPPGFFANGVHSYCIANLQVLLDDLFHLLGS